ncbi:MAG: NfeD family protein [Synechococcales cyanobacterium K44_A2020_017]|nr:NfeD family protein [Synechococcales cyanobacterium K32_A2020_035]MBF2094028.1 NfeD family protein [Synechococcales cyanobacterium K44_A2020_017]
MVSMEPPLIWLIAGVILCVMEFTIPTAFTEFTLGVSAIIVALVALVVPQVSIQIVLWLVLSVVATLMLRRFMPPQTNRVLEDATDAKTLTEILPGETGRVLYEGNSWPARCEDDVAIAPNQFVYVVGRRGNILLVMPETSIHPR